MGVPAQDGRLGQHSFESPPRAFTPPMLLAPLAEVTTCSTARRSIIPRVPHEWPEVGVDTVINYLGQSAPGEPNRTTNLGKGYQAIFHKALDRAFTHLQKVGDFLDGHRF